MKKDLWQMSAAELDAELRYLRRRDTMVSLTIGLVCLILVLLLKK